MSPAYDLLVAILIITSPVAIERAPTHFELANVQVLSVEMELVDRRECRYVANRMSDHDSCLKTIRDRYVKLVDAPPVADCERLPSRECLSKCLELNRELRKTFEAKSSLFGGAIKESYEQAVKETDRLFTVYDLMRDARSEQYFIYARRLAMKDLRDLWLGPEAYYSCQYPPCVPLWRLEEIK